MCNPIGTGIGHDDISIVCEQSGKRITHSDIYGTWCDDECDREKSVALTVLNPDGTVNHEESMKLIYGKAIGEG
jgi:hypothetical protein